eukprot:TRINITY_DN4468_c0_g1_i3.p1 TRINITY_DN4468_c0_g1~~TRINITY_DN4468_c0_g1_i3.p1  ORF type:complete len:255 (-),score=47.73 TRINITY_DN4468_c0_g1_i3:99-863(-)
MQTLQRVTTKFLRRESARNSSSKISQKRKSILPILQVKRTTILTPVFSRSYRTCYSLYEKSENTTENNTQESTQEQTQDKRTENNVKQPSQQQQQPEPPKENPEVKQMKEKIKDLEQRLIYSLAERENIRKIADREVVKAKEFGVQNLVKKLFSVVDTVNVCLNNASKDNTEAINGFTAVKKDIEKVFREFNVVEFEPKIGDQFDMHKHDAIFHSELEGAKPGTVSVVVKSGWIRNDKVLRAAQVGVVPNNSNS